MLLIPEEFKCELIVLFLTGDAETWWKGVEPSLPKPTTWSDFRRVFLTYY